MWDPPASRVVPDPSQVAQPIPDDSDSSNNSLDKLMSAQDTQFDPEKTLNCSVEGGYTLIHGPGGQGYGLCSNAITSGCYQWKVNIY